MYLHFKHLVVGNAGNSQINFMMLMLSLLFLVLVILILVLLPCSLSSTAKFYQGTLAQSVKKSTYLLAFAI